MRILITGAAGMLGTDVRAAAWAAGHDPIALTRAELDIADPAAVTDTFAAQRPDAVINCAAWTDVDGAEAAPEAATRVNGEGAGHVARAAAALGAWTVHVSTDYVFAGTGNEPYQEADPVSPASAYGASKLAGERAVAAAAPTAHTIVRTAWLFGAAGACFPRTILRLATERPSLSVVDDQIGSPTYTGHLAPALIELAGTRTLGIVHATAVGECSWFQFAQAIVAAAGVDCEIGPCTTAEYPRPAPRPAYSVLRSGRGAQAPVLPPWSEGLAAYLASAEVIA